MTVRVTLVLPPLTQLNTPYPSTAYLARCLRAQGVASSQRDLGLELVLALFSRPGLERIFDELEQAEELPEPAWRALALRSQHLACIEPVIRFLQGRDRTLAPRILDTPWLPRGPRLASADLSAFGPVDTDDAARRVATLYLEDLADLVTAGIDPGFELARYHHHLALGPTSFEPLAARLAHTTLVDEALDALADTLDGDLVGLSVPFPGNLYGALRIGRRLQARGIEVVLGGGYVNTELRGVSEPRLWDCVDALTYDAGEGPLLALLEHLDGGPDRRHRTLTQEGWHQAEVEPPPSLPVAWYGDLPLGDYLQLVDTLNPAHRLWSDGRWNKATLAHGCYWKRCTFCDIQLDYIGRYVPSPVPALVDAVEELVEETGQSGLHLVDEAAPPKLLRDLALELLARDRSLTWWGNIRFESAFTPDLCRLLAASGLVAVTGGLEVASDRLLERMDKGVRVDDVARVAAAVCEDGNDCTTDDCDATTGCTATPNTASCDDGDDCTTSDACADSACVGGAAVNCDDGLLCTDDSCIPASGCAWVPNAAACDDSDACTSDDACVDGACQGGAPIACNDDNPCTDDACLPGSGCAYVPNTQPCDDGAFCTDADMCSGGACVPGPPLNCGALDACQVSVTCDDDLDECAVETAPDGTSCNDGDSCTVDDTCAAGDCVAGAPYDGCPVSQDDCLAYACQSQGPEQQPKCVLGPLPAGSECQDGLFCTVDDACNAAGECEPGAPRDCSDAAVICQTGVCDDEDDVCKAAQAVDKTPCDDGDPCTVDSLCLAGVCAVQGWACADHQISVFDSVEGATTPDLASVGDGRFVAAWYAKGGTDVRARAVNRYMGLEDTSQQTPAGGSSRREVQVAALADGGAVTGFIVRKLSYKNTPDPCKQCCISNDPKCKADPCPNWKLLGDGCKKCDGSAPNCGNTCNQTIHKGSILREERVTLVWRDANNNIVAGPLNVLKKDDFSKSWGNICNQPGNPGHSVDIHDLRLTGLGDGRTVMLVTFGGVPTGRLLSPTGTVELNLSLGWTSSAGHDVAALDDTSFVVVWSDGKVIRAQPYTSAGVAAGPQIIVAADNGATQVEPSAVGLPGTGGRFAVGWETNVTGDWDIRTQVAKIGGLIGPQIVANTVAAGQQRMASVGAFDSGGFVVAWEDDHGQDGDGDGIFARFLGKGGEPVTQQRQINIGSGGDQQLPVAVGLDDGRAIIAWRNPAGHVLARGFDAGGSSVEIAPERVIAAADDVSSDSPRAAATPGGGALVAYRSSGDSGATAAVWVQRYAADEQPAGAPTSLGAATQTGNLGLGSQPDIATDATGAAIVVWDPYGLDGEFEGIFGIRLTAAGALTGSALQINQYTLSTQNAPAVARALDGRFAVAWTSLTQPGGDGTDVMLRCYSADASPLSEEVFAHPVVTKNQQTPRLAAFNDLTKRFVAVWMSRDMPGDPGWGIQARIFDEKCQPTGEPFQINGDTTGDQHTPHVATALQVGGGFTVGWTGVDASGAGAFARRFDSDGLQQGGELQLNTFVSNGQWVGDIASYPSGAMLVGWRSGGEDGSTAVVLRGLSAKGEAAGLPFIANPTFSGEQSRPSVSVLSTGKTLLLWQNKPGAVSQVLGRWLSAP